MSSLSASFGHAHSDVLSAKPSTAEEKEMLVKELKDRGRKAFASGAMPVADALYTKAIEVAPEAAIHANRSAVRLTLGKAADAVEDAEAAAKLDPTYAKAYFRLGGALEALDKYGEALKAYEKGASLEADSKVWPNSLAKCRKRQEAYETKLKEAPVKKTEPVIERYEVQATTAKPAEKKKSPSDIRGYKIDSQGRKTTFFNNEMDDQTKKLIGDIAPKKVEKAVNMNVQEGSSSWNQAGTFESKDHTKWAKEWLGTKLGDLMIDLPDREIGGLKVEQFLTVKKFHEFKGDASTAQARGKKKWLVDISFTLDWEFATDDKGGVAKGSAKFLDASCDGVDEDEAIEFALEVDPLTPPEAANLINSHVKKEDCGLRPAVFAVLAELVKEFRATK